MTIRDMLEDKGLEIDAFVKSFGVEATADAGEEAAVADAGEEAAVADAGEEAAVADADAEEELSWADAEVDAAETYPIENCWITVKDVSYTGKKIKKPSVKVKWGDIKLKEGEDYTFSYDKKARDIGLYMLNIKGEGQFTGSVDVPFYVVPKARTLIKMMNGDKQAALIWKCLKNITKFQIEYSMDEDFADSQKEKIKKSKDLNKLVKKLKAGKKYYVRVRVYATVGNEKYHSAWSQVKTLKL